MTKRFLKEVNEIFHILNGTGKFYITIIVFISILSSVFPSISLLLMREILNLLQKHTGDMSKLMLILTLYISLDVIQSLLAIVTNYCERRMQMQGTLTIQLSILNKVKDFTLHDFEDAEVYDNLQRATRVTFQRIYGLFKALLILCQTLINAILFGIVLFLWKWWMLPMVLILPITNAILNAYFGKKQFGVIQSRSQDERKAWYFQYILTRDIAFKEIRVFGLYDYFLNKFKRIHLRFIRQDKKILNERIFASAILTLLEDLVNAVVLGFIILEAYCEKILLGDLTTYVRCIANINSNGQGFLSQLNRIYEDSLYIEQYFNLMEKECENNCAKKDQEHYISRDKVITNIRISNLSYKYKNQKNYALKDINLEIKQNSIVALVGRNGSGKSTLVKLLTKLYDDYEGEIFFGDIPLSSVDSDFIRLKISVLFQDFVRYELSARENIAFGDLKKLEDTEGISRTLKLVGMDKRVDDIDMQLGAWFDSGVQLSGGEWLKVALGRCLIRDAELYILDEPNSSLDPISERVVFNAFKEIAKGKIGIIISHRIEKVKDIANQIVVFNNGRIEDIGTHETLMNTCPIYADMYSTEFNGKIEEGEKIEI